MEPWGGKREEEEQILIESTLKFLGIHEVQKVRAYYALTVYYW